MGKLVNQNKKESTTSLKNMINDERTKKHFQDLLGKKTQGFLVSLLSIANNNKLLANADPSSILKAGATAATLDLPVDQNFGYAYIVPYKDNKKGVIEAQFQMGYKGYIQLAIRSGQYHKINTTELYEGQFISYDPITDELVYDLEARISDKVTHYVAYFKTMNGFEKYYLMSREEVEKHAKTFSQSYKKGFGVWADNFDMMATKTVLKLLLSKFGILSIEMQTAVKADQAVIKEVDGNNVEVEYVDNSDIEINEIEESDYEESTEDDFN